MPIEDDNDLQRTCIIQRSKTKRKTLLHKVEDSDKTMPYHNQKNPVFLQCSNAADQSHSHDNHTDGNEGGAVAIAVFIHDGGIVTVVCL